MDLGRAGGRRVAADFKGMATDAGALLLTDKVVKLTRRVVEWFARSARPSKRPRRRQSSARPSARAVVSSFGGSSAIVAQPEIAGGEIRNFWRNSKRPQRSELRP